MGHCFFLYTPPLAPGVQARLAFLRQCHDGFAIAEKDWAWRGGGQCLGTKQSGKIPYRFFLPEHHFFPEAAQRARELCTETASFWIRLFCQEESLLAG